MSGSPTTVTGDRLVSSPEAVALSPDEQRAYDRAYAHGYNAALDAHGIALDADQLDEWDVPIADAMYECCIAVIPDTDHDAHVMKHLRRNGWAFHRISPSVT